MLDLSPLDRIGWLSGESREFRDWVARAGQWRTYTPGQFIYHAGDPSNGIFGLAEGVLEVSFPLLAQEPVIIHRAEQGFWLGDSAELSETRRTVSLMAATTCRLLRLPGGAARALLQEQPALWPAFYRLSAINSHKTVELLSESLALTVRARVCRRLLDLASQSVDVIVTQESLSKLLGVTRGTMRRCLADLAERGAIELGYGKLRLRDRAVLECFRDEQ